MSAKGSQNTMEATLMGLLGFAALAAAFDKAGEPAERAKGRRRAEEFRRRRPTPPSHRLRMTATTHSINGGVRPAAERRATAEHRRLLDDGKLRIRVAQGDLTAREAVNREADRPDHRTREGTPLSKKRRGTRP